MSPKLHTHSHTHTRAHTHAQAHARLVVIADLLPLAFKRVLIKARKTQKCPVGTRALSSAVNFPYFVDFFFF